MVSNNDLNQRVPLSSTPPSLQHIFSTQKGHSFSIPKIPQFHTTNPSVQHNPLSSKPKSHQFNTPSSVKHQKTLSSTPLSSISKTPHFHAPQFHTKDPSVPHKKPLSSTHSSQFHTKNPSTLFDVELRGFLCRTEGFLVWN